MRIKKPTFTKEKINDVVDFMNQYEYNLIFYKIVKLENNLYTIVFFGLHKSDSYNLKQAINDNFSG